MLKKLRSLTRVVMGAGCLFAGIAIASDSQPSNQTVVESGFSGTNVQKFIDELAADKRFSREEIESIISNAKRSEDVLRLISKPAEKELEWKDYRSIFLTEQRIEEGVEFWKKNRNVLKGVENKYGVPAHIIVAITGVETYYGRLSGGFSVLDALATLSFAYPPRSKFFTKELREFLILAKEQNLDIDELTGSYAGAMGIPQFMPSSYRAYAVDYKSDGQANIWFQNEDAIASIANYLKKNGWKPGESIVSRAKVKGSRYKQAVAKSLKANREVSELKGYGWTPEQKLSATTRAGAMIMAGERGDEYWLGLHNFFVITTYNRSTMYALAVTQLAEEIKTHYQKN